MIYRVVCLQGYPLPLYRSPVPAGFPSPADDHIDGALDLNDLLIHRPAATFLMKCAGDSMIGAGIHNGDILIVDRSLEPKDGKIIIAAVNGELTVKRLKQRGEHIFLEAENSHYPAIELAEGDELDVWGVVTSVIHRV